ncbi:MAG: Fe-S cluster assembly protein SufD [Candidatus Marinimicrobia bacterium]|nr:Fe-S cluster assembly protein SufD [Candidatus Neomarinimicrobiota bacterium]
MLNRNYFSKSLHPYRKEAFTQLEKTGFPTQKWENWRFTNVSNISDGEFMISEISDAPQTTPDIDSYQMEGVDTVVIYNGHYQKDISSIPNGVNLLSGSEYMERKNGNFDRANNSPFDLLNTAFTDSGMCIVLEKNTLVKSPIRILFISNGDRSIMVNPRVNVDIGESSSLTFIEQHVGDATSFFQNESVFITLGDNAQLNHVRIQSNSEFTQNISNLNINQAADSQYEFFQLVDGSKLGRSDICVQLDGENAQCNINSLTLSKNNQHIDNNIIVNHNSAQTHSSQFVKSILFDTSTGVFNGRAVVHENAQKITAQQTNKNILLSKKAKMNANPQLEIYADDVKCSHGSTTGQIDEEALFYLQSRGINKQDAMELMVVGFANEVLDKIPHPEIKKAVYTEFTAKLNRLMS